MSTHATHTHNHAERRGEGGEVVLPIHSMGPFHFCASSVFDYVFILWHCVAEWMRRKMWNRMRSGRDPRSPQKSIYCLSQEYIYRNLMKTYTVDSISLLSRMSCHLLRPRAAVHFAHKIKYHILCDSPTQWARVTIFAHSFPSQQPNHESSVFAQTSQFYLTNVIIFNIYLFI